MGNGTRLVVGVKQVATGRDVTNAAVWLVERHQNLKGVSVDARHRLQSDGMGHYAIVLPVSYGAIAARKVIVEVPGEMAAIRSNIQAAYSK